MSNTHVSLAPTAVDADGISASQTPGAGAILINGALASGGTVTLGAAQLIRLTSGGNDSGITFTFIGTDADGNAQTETVAGTNASNSDTTKYFKTITSIPKSGASAGTIIVGNLITSVSKTLRMNTGVPINASIVAELVSGSGTFTMQQTYDNAPDGYPSIWIDNTTLTGKTATFDMAFNQPVTGFRLKATASTSLVANLRLLQAGV